MADRVKGGQAEVEDEPVRIVLLPSTEEDELAPILFGLVLGPEGHTQNAEAIAAIEELESDGRRAQSTIEALFAKLNADD